MLRYVIEGNQGLLMNVRDDKVCWSSDFPNAVPHSFERRSDAEQFALRRRVGVVTVEMLRHVETGPDEEATWLFVPSVGDSFEVLYVSGNYAKLRIDSYALHRLFELFPGELRITNVTYDANGFTEAWVRATGSKRRLISQAEYEDFQRLRDADEKLLSYAR